MIIEVTEMKKGKKAQDIDLVNMVLDLIEADTKIREKAGLKVRLSSEEIALGRDIIEKFDRIDNFADNFIMPLIGHEFDISNEKSLEYMKRTNDKLSEIIDDMERLLFGAFKLDEVKRNDNED